MILLDWMLILVLWVASLLKLQVAFGVSWLSLCLGKVCPWAVCVVYLALVCLSVRWAFSLNSSKEVFALDSVLRNEPKPPRAPLMGPGRGGQDDRRSPGTQLYLLPVTTMTLGWCPHLLKVIILSDSQYCGHETAWAVGSVPLEGR